MLRDFGERIGVTKPVFALSSARLGDGIGNSILFIVLPLYVAKLRAPWFNWPESIRVGILISLFGLAALLIEPVMGSVIDRFGRRKLWIQVGLILIAAATVAFAWADRYIWLLLLRAVQGLGLGITVPAVLALITVVTRRETRGRSMGFLTTMRMLGMALGPLIGGFLLSHVSFNSAFYTGAGFLAAAILLVQWWVKEPQEPDRGSDRMENIGWFDKRVWSPGVMTACAAVLAMAIAFTLMTTLEKQFNQRLHQNAFWFGVAFSALTVSRLILQFPAGWLSDRWGRRPLIIIGLIVMAPATAVIGVVDSTGQLIASRVAQGIASAGIAAPALALAADSSSASGRGRQMSLPIMGFSLGLALGPLLAGFLSTVFFELPFIVAGALCLLAAWIVWQFAPETVGRNVQIDQ